jgi:2-amino-4-hydroxy-6-hydroxymethyldihydropteridine diphosphokinase
LRLTSCVLSLLLAQSHECITNRYKTDPAYVKDQPSFLNAACHIRTSLSPSDLLASLKDMEQQAGRDLVAGQRNGPRPLDIDIISSVTLIFIVILCAICLLPNIVIHN